MRSLRLRRPVVVTTGANMAVVIRRMRKAGVGSCLIVNEDERLIGIVTERDLLNKVSLRATDLGKIKVDALMQPDPETLTLDHPIAYALNRMAGGGYRNIPLVDRAGRVTGLVTLRDVVEEVCDHFSDEVLTLPPTRRAAIAREREGA